jgi:MFS family permease
VPTISAALDIAPLVRSFPKSDLLRTMSFVVPALVAPMLGPVAGGLIVDYLHWRIIGNTLLLGVLLMVFAIIGVRTPIWLIVLQAYGQY